MQEALAPSTDREGPAGQLSRGIPARTRQGYPKKPRPETLPQHQARRVPRHDAVCRPQGRQKQGGGVVFVVRVAESLLRQNVETGFRSVVL